MAITDCPALDCAEVRYDCTVRMSPSFICWAFARMRVCRFVTRTQSPIAFACSLAFDWRRSSVLSSISVCTCRKPTTPTAAITSTVTSTATANLAA